MSMIYVLHENREWLAPLQEAFDFLGLPNTEWFLDSGSIAFDSAPPEGVFYNRMSASSHTRGHRFAPELTHAALQWLELHGRPVHNNSRALYLELSKVAQYAALQRAGIHTPRSVVACGRDAVLAAAEHFTPRPFILKPNRGGKGLGVQLFHSITALRDFVHSPVFDDTVDGLWLLQEYIEAPEPFITRCEFVGGRFVYAVQVSTAEGFELCPADACAVEGAFCPADAGAGTKFRIDADFREPRLVAAYERFLQANGITIAGIEFIRDRQGRIFSYDVNTNTNYNMQAESNAGIAQGGMLRIAHFLGAELAQHYPRAVEACPG